MTDLMREEMKKAYEDVVGEPWDDAGLHKQAWCISWEKAWQASRECLVIELPKPHAWDNDGGLERDNNPESECSMALIPAVDARQAIHAVGLKTK